MPNFVNPDEKQWLMYDQNQSAIEGRFVTGFQSCAHAEVATIICPSGTANLTVWANNSAYWDKYVPNYMAQLDPNYGYTRAERNLQNASFSGNWVDITTHPSVILGAKMIVINAPVRFLRLHGAAASLSGSTSGSPVAYVWTDNCEPMT